MKKLEKFKKLKENNITSLLDATPELEKRVLDLILKLEELKEGLEKIHYTKDEKIFFSRMWGIWDFFNTFDDEEVFSIFSHTQEFEDYQIFFRQKDWYFERALDTAQSLDIIAKNTDNDILELLDYSFSKKVFLQASDEIKEVDEQKINTLVMVGCGPMPETVIYIAENTNIPHIIALDSDPEAILMAGRVVRKLGLDKRITFECSYGENYNYQSADCVHMANFVRGKNLVLDQISKTAKNKCQVIARKTRLLSILAYEEIYPDLHPRLIVKKSVRGIFYNFYIFEKFYFSEKET